MQGNSENKRTLLAHKIRWRTQTLFFSLILNVTFLGVFFYFFVRENPIPITFSYKPAPPIKEHYFTNNEVFNALEKIPFDKLSLLLKDKRHIEDGVTMRDLALSVLISKEKLDIERALGGKTTLKGTLKVNGEKTLPLYDIGEEDFNLITHFAAVEKCPFTFERLFLVLKEQQFEADPSLIQMFFQSDEFMAVEKLFSTTPMQKKILLTLLLEGNSETLQTFSEEQKNQFDISDKKRREFLLKYLVNGSSTAAILLLHTDMNFAVKFFDDKVALCLLQNLPEKSEKGQLYASQLLNSPRSDIIKKAAELYLSQDKELAKKFFNRPSIGELRPVYREAPPAAPAPNQHIILPGESLWSISRKYGVPLDTIMQLNNLTTTNLHPGKILRLP